mmetsp:Transcript_70248/g.81894  ORF Transcript_70248/g.81894 Transcript_70248/m.81894 type:complete len:173 (+) Transcript_70248:31-549(+)
MLILKNAFKQGLGLAKPAFSLPALSKAPFGILPYCFENTIQQQKSLIFTPLAYYRYMPAAAAKCKLFKKKYTNGRPKNAKRSKFSRKRSIRKEIRDYKPTNHNGLLARIRIVGPRHDRKFKCRPAGGRHLLRNKSKNNFNRRKRVKFIDPADMRRMKKLIPYYKRQKLKRMH